MQRDSISADAVKGPPGGHFSARYPSAEREEWIRLSTSTTARPVSARCRSPRPSRSTGSHLPRLRPPRPRGAARDLLREDLAEELSGSRDRGPGSASRPSGRRSGGARSERSQDLVGDALVVAAHHSWNPEQIDGPPHHEPAQGHPEEDLESPPAHVAVLPAHQEA